MTARGALLTLFVALTGGVWFGACDRMPPPRFAHEAHLTGIPWNEPGSKWLVCTSCHAGTRKTGARIYPEQALCDRCHATDGKGKLPAAPPGDEARALATSICFTHEPHLRIAEINGQCTACHAGISDPTRAAASFPPMKACESCHERDIAEARCSLCHDPRDLAEILPQTFLRHDEGWIRRHGAAATREAKVCGQCHSDVSCKDCHDTSQTLPIEVRRPEAVTATFVHRGDFVTRHALEARSQPATCVRCHTPSSCDGCHVQRGVSAGAAGGADPHPRGWVGAPSSSPSSHGAAARIDIVSCAACHDKGPATNCILCHKVGGAGGNPHPRGFSSSRSPRQATCRLCHAS
jgi:hypothetical protein